MSIGCFRLHRFNGVEEFLLEEATITALLDEDGLRLWFEATTGGEPLRTLPDTIELQLHPKAELSIAIKDFDSEKLVGQRFSLPSGYDEATDDHVATICYVDHDELDENQLEIVARQENLFHVRWTGLSTDVNDCDDSTPKTRLEIDGWFTLLNMQK